MAYKPHVKMQMQLVSSGSANMAYIEFSEKILLLDRVRGTFIKKEEVVIDFYKRIFGTKVRYYVQGPVLPLLITDGRKRPVGILLPVKIKNDRLGEL